MISTYYSIGAPSPVEHFISHELEKAIERCVGTYVEQVLWVMDEEGGLSRSQTMEVISEVDRYDTVAVGLTLEQMVEAIEEGMELYEPFDFSVPFQMLRTEIENRAIYFINLLAEGRAMEIFEELHDAMDEHCLEPEQIRYDNSLARLPHRSEREEGPFTVYEYRNIEDPGLHIDIWEYVLPDGSALYFEVVLEDE